MTFVDITSKRALYVLVVFILSMVSLYSLGFVNVGIIEQMKLSWIYQLSVVIAAIVGFVLLKKLGDKKVI